MGSARLNETHGPVLVSACLLGLQTRHDGRDSRSPAVVALIQNSVLIPVCPEQLGGLPTPRSPAEITKDDGAEVLDGRSAVCTPDGADVTKDYLRGARCVLQIAEMFGAERAILKEGSPACGVRCITRGGIRVPGRGVTASLLQRKGIELEGIE